MFPGGAAGVGLLVLRLCCAGAILTMGPSRGLSVVSIWTAVGLALLALLMVAGALTPLACAAGTLVEASHLLHGHGMDLSCVVFALLVTVVLGLLGPGAFSVDAKLFGRRRIISHGD
jgi:Na+-translocating ferredoxin:NAD+ oxidoreductase RnfE subunit